MPDSTAIRAALAADDDDRIVFDLTGIEAQYGSCCANCPACRSGSP